MEHQYVCLLRGINVSGKNKIKMAELKPQLQSLGLEEVRTYIQSGNIVFKAKAGQSAEWAAKIKAMIQEVWGFDIKVMCVAEGDFRNFLQQSPYWPEKEEEIKYLAFTLMTAVPEEERMALLEAKKKGEEDFKIIGQGLYLYCPYGFGRTKLSNNEIERIFKLGATTRNWKTMQQLEAMLNE
ncbi:MAG: DUF1697 domain-containing protein [Bacteroidota bacterium]